MKHLSLFASFILSVSYSSLTMAQSLEDANADAKWDALNSLNHAVGADGNQQNFEDGFSDRQSLDGWVSIGNGNAVRFGFGNSLNEINWGAEIAQVGGPVTAFGPNDKPLGTYVSGDYFLSDGDPNQSSSFLFMQFAKPIAYLSFLSYNYGAGSERVSFTSQAYSGKDFASAAIIPANNSGLIEYQGSEFSGDLYGHLLNISRWDTSTPFNLVSIQFHQDASAIGFDNFSIRTISAVPEPETVVYMLAGLAALLARRKGRTRG